MKKNNSRREFLSQSCKMVTAAALFGTSVPLAHAAVSGTLNCDANNTMKITDPHGAPDRRDSERQNCCPAREQAASGRHAAAL